MELTLSVLVVCIVVGAFVGGITFGIRRKKVRLELTEQIEATFESRYQKLIHNMKLENERLREELESKS